MFGLTYGGRECPKVYPRGRFEHGRNRGGQSCVCSRIHFCRQPLRYLHPAFWLGGTACRFGSLYGCIRQRRGFESRPRDGFTGLYAYVLYAANGFSGVLEGTVDASLYPEDTRSVTVNGLTGIVTPQEVTEGYILQNQGDGVRFYRVGDVPFALPAGRCYLSASVSVGVNLRMERNATALRTAGRTWPCRTTPVMTF